MSEPEWAPTDISRCFEDVPPGPPFGECELVAGHVGPHLEKPERARPVPQLDMERLAVALQFVYHGPRDGWRRAAAEIAAAYSNGNSYDDPRDSGAARSSSGAGT